MKLLKFGILSLMMFFTLGLVAQSKHYNWPPDKYVTEANALTLSWNKADTIPSLDIQVATDSLFSSIIASQNNLTDRHFTLNSLILGQQYWWRLKESSQSTWNLPRSFITFSPILLDSIRQWHNPDSFIVIDGSNRVSAWKNMVTNDSIEQTDPTKRPLLINDLNKDGLYFNHIEFLLDDSVYTKNKNVSSFIVMRPDTTKDWTAIAYAIPGALSSKCYEYVAKKGRTSLKKSDGVAAAGVHYSNYSFANTISLQSYTIDNTNLSKTYFNKVYNNQKAYTATQFLNNQKRFCMGASMHSNSTFFYNQFRGLISEYIFVHESLNDSLRNLTEDYLLFKHAPPLELGVDIYRDYSFCPITLQANEKFTSYSWSTGESTSSIQVNQPGAYWCTVVDFFGRTCTDTINIIDRIQQPQLNDTLICLDDSAPFDAFIGPDYSYEWDANPVNNSNLFSTGIKGYHYVEITDSFSCSTTDSVYLDVNEYKLNVSLGPDRSFCEGEDLELATGNSQTISWLWSTSPNDTLSSISLFTNGQYFVDVTDTLGCQGSDTINITIRSIAPTPYFKLNSNALCLEYSLQITDSSYTDDPYDQIDSWEWNFGDGTTSSMINPTHLYNSDGLFNVKLEITTDSGCTKRLDTMVRIYPHPQIHILPRFACSGMPVEFFNLLDPDSGSFSWEFVDPSLPVNDTSQLNRPKYTYYDGGEYTIKLTQTSNNNCISSDSIKLLVRQSPKAGFIANPTKPCFGETVLFTDTSVGTSTYPITSWTWDFGDNSSLISGTNNPAYYFNQPGTYSVILKVSSSASGCFNSDTVELKIGEIPVASIDSAVFCQDQSNTLFSNSYIPNNDSIKNWIWQIESIGQLTGNPVSITPITSGALEVNILVESFHGCRDSLDTMIYVNPVPEASFTLTPYFGEPPADVSFINQTPGINSYLWDFGDTSISTVNNPMHTYTTEGIYNITLQAVNEFGCVSEYTNTFFATTPDIDLQITDLRINYSDATMEFEIDLFNNSNYEINAIQFINYLNGGNLIVEGWEAENPAERLQAFETRTYSFKTKYFTDPALNINMDYLCVEAHVADLVTDSDPSNNKYCEALNLDYQVLDPYPNPADDATTLEIISNNDRVIKIWICNSVGAEILQINNVSISQGLNSINLPLIGLNEGVYYIWIQSEGSHSAKKIIKL